MLGVILKRLQAKAEELLVEEQAGFTQDRSAIEQIFSSRVIIEKHPQHHRSLFHNFLDFKKAFGIIWHAGLWQVLRGYNIDEGVVRAIQAIMRTQQCSPLKQSARQILQRQQ